MIFITTNFDLPAATMAKRYKMRWKIELFFKGKKRNVPIQTFFGNNENAVRTQVWVAVCIYLIVAIIKKEQKILQPMSEILQVLGILQFEKRPISEQFTAFDSDNPEGRFANQLLLLGLEHNTNDLIHFYFILLLYLEMSWIRCRGFPGTPQK